MGRRPIRKVGPDREQEHRHERAETSIRGRRTIHEGGDQYEGAEAGTKRRRRVASVAAAERHCAN